MTNTVPVCPHCQADISAALALAVADAFERGYAEGVEYERRQWQAALDRNAGGERP